VQNRCFVAGCDGRLHVIDLDKGEAVSSVPIDSPTGCTPAVMGDVAFVGTEDGSFFALNWREASQVWTYKPDRPLSIRSSAAATPEVVIVGSRDKQVHGLDPKSGDKLWTFATRGRFDSSPVIAGKRAYIGSSDGRVYALDVKNGSKVWEYEAGGDFAASPAVAAGRLVIGNTDGTLYCFGAK
jgi:outer membrane protein assembly factor BamB